MCTCAELHAGYSCGSIWCACHPKLATLSEGEADEIQKFVDENGQFEIPMNSEQQLRTKALEFACISVSGFNTNGITSEGILRRAEMFEKYITDGYMGIG